MIDEKMQKSVNETILLVEKLKAKSKDELAIELNSLSLYEDGLSIEEMIDRLLHFYVSETDLSYYKKYLDFVRYRQINLMGESLDVLTESATQIATLYEKRNEQRKLKLRSRDIVRNVDSVFRVIPTIRAKLEYSHVESLRRNYLTATRNDGMQRAKITEAITAIDNKGVILRALNTRKAKKLRDKLIEHNINSFENLHKTYEDFAKQVKAYCDLLRSIFYGLLEDPIICSAAIMSAKLISREGTNFEQDDLGLTKPTRQEIEEVNKENIYSIFVKFSNFPSADDVDDEMFFKAMERFITHYDNTIIARVDTQLAISSNKIATLFDGQMMAIDKLAEERESFVDSTKFSVDEDETFTLVYTNRKTEKNV